MPENLYSKRQPSKKGMNLDLIPELAAGNSLASSGKSVTFIATMSTPATKKISKHSIEEPKPPILRTHLQRRSTALFLQGLARKPAFALDLSKLKA